MRRSREKQHMLTDKKNCKDKVFVEVPEATAYVQDPQREAILRAAILSDSPRFQTTRVHQDDPSLYTEDGIAHKDDEYVDRVPLPKSDSKDLFDITLSIEEVY